MRIQIMAASACLTVLAACADHPRAGHPAGSLCRVVQEAQDLPPPSPESFPRSNIFKLNYSVPTDIAAQGLHSRTFVRLKVDGTGNFDSAEFLQLDAPPRVEQAMCDLVRKLRWEVTQPQEVDFGVRMCSGNCNNVPVFPGFERHEIAITASRVSR